MRCVRLGQAAAQAIEQRKIHQTWQVRHIAVGIFFAALPVRDHQRDIAPLFADDIQFRIFRHDPFRPVGEKLLIRITVGIGANTGKSCVFDPPDRVLNLIRREHRISLVHVRHAFFEPAVGEILAIDFRCVRVARRGARVVGDVEFAIERKPIFTWHVSHPPVITADVIDDNILNHADAFLPRLGHHPPIVVIAAESRIDLVRVGRTVAVIRVRGLIVFNDRCRPDLRVAHRRDVIEMIDDTLDIATVSTGTIVAAIEFIEETRYTIIGRIAVGKAIRHQIQNHVRRIETDAIG